MECEKKETNSKTAIQMFKEREIWWCKVGVSVGCEMDKRQNFLRPVLILKKPPVTHL